MSTDPNIRLSPDNTLSATLNFQLLFERVPGLLLVLLPTEDFTIAAMSDAYSKRSMLSRDNVIGKGLFSVFPDDPADASSSGSINLRSSLLQVVEYRQPDPMPLQKYNIRRPDGTFEPGYWSVINSPVLDPFGNILYIIHKVEDVTEYVKLKNPQENASMLLQSEGARAEAEVYLRAQEVQKANERLKNSSTDLLRIRDELVAQLFERNRELERAKAAVENERENFRNLFRQTPEMVCILSGTEHVFEFVNMAHIKALSFDATGMSVREAQPESVEVHGILDKVYQTGQTAVLGEIPVTVGSKLRYFNLTYAARRGVDEAISGIMILGSEVTEQVEAREAIMKAKVAADAANTAKSSFLANMSHEIRTPIGIITGFCELLRDDESMTPDDQKEYLDRMIKNAKGLTRIIDDILDLAKVEAGKLEVEKMEFSLADLLLEVADFFSERAREKGIYLKLKFENPLPGSIHSDPVRLRQILVNIIGNAIKFTTSGGVTVSARSQDEADGRLKLEIKVKDTGIGLSKSQAEKIFQPFVQADSGTSRLFGGTGLGLVISQRLATALGGNIHIEDCSENEGCNFVITLFDLTFGRLPNNAQARSMSSENSLELINVPKLLGLKVLIAEDSKDNQLFLTRVLVKNGAEIEMANDGEEAIQKALNGNCDVILMDVQMPRVNGLEATRALRKAGFIKPIIALTAHAMVEEKVRTKEAGCNAHLTKPINVDALMEIIEKHVKFVVTE